MRMKVLHSMAAGKAVVTTSRGAEGLNTLGSDCPLKIADDAGAFAQATVALLQNTSERRELGAAARSFVAEHFSPQAYAQRVEMTYAQMLEQKNRTTGNAYG
jgi:polysaccharide biosynthesis protein PslH